MNAKCVFEINKLLQLREQWNQKAFDVTAKKLKMPLTSYVILQSVEEFFCLIKDLPEKTFAKLITFLNVWRLLFGFDSAGLIGFRSNKKMYFTAQEISLLEETFKNSNFVFIKKRKKKAVENFFLINKIALACIVQQYSGVFHDQSVGGVLAWIKQHVYEINKHHAEYGYISGFPSDSVEVFTVMEGVSEQLVQDWSNYRYRLIKKTQLLNTLRQSKLPWGIRRKIKRTISFYAKYQASKEFAKENVSPGFDFVIANKTDLAYARGRDYWLRELMSIYSKLLPAKLRKELMEHWGN